MNQAETTQEFLALKYGADKLRSRRNSALLCDGHKELRKFTRQEASSYLSIDVKTLDRYAKQLNIDPRRHIDTVWSLDIQEMYKVRDCLPLEKRKEPKFIRSANQTTQVITIQNQKGGVSKTLTAATVASGLASEFHEEYRVGLVDMDGQGTLSMYYATEADLEGRLSVGDLIMGNYDLDEGQTVKDAISEAFLPTTIPNLRILPAAQSDRTIEGWFHKAVFNGELKNPYAVLKSILDEVKDDFDIIIIDTPPSLGYATLNAYYAGTSSVFPLAAAPNDVDATCSYFSYIPQVWELLKGSDHPGYDFLKVLLTNHKEGTTTSKIHTSLCEAFPTHLYSKEFRNSEAIRQTSERLSTIFDMSKSAYTKTKSSFDTARVNAYEISSQILRDIQAVWRKQDGEY